MADDPMTPDDWWVRGWVFGKYGQEEPLPAVPEDAAEWLDGYKRGRAEIGQFETWRSDLVRDKPEILKVIDEDPLTPCAG